MVTDGHDPQMIHMMDNSLMIVYLDSNDYVCARTSTPTIGNYDDLVWTDNGRIALDTNVSHMKIKKVVHQGIYGFWSSLTYHKFVVKSIPFALSDFVEDGTISINADTPVSSLSLTVNNTSNLKMGDFRMCVTPFCKLSLNLFMGSSGPYPMGTFYSDRVQGKREEFKLSVSARNTIGKLLKDQTFDDTRSFQTGTTLNNLGLIMDMAGVKDYFIASFPTDDSANWNMKFDKDTYILDGLNAIIELMHAYDWQIAETGTGVVGIGPSTDTRFDVPGYYSFVRNETCWSCDVSEDDQDVYSKVCITVEGDDTVAEKTFYTVLKPHQYYQIPSHKTLFATVPRGTSDARVASYAAQISSTMEKSGRVETFAGIFTPQLTKGDTVMVIDDPGVESIVGTVTEVEHHFGKSGYYTEFTVDGGGRIGKPMLSTFIDQISKSQKADAATKVTISS